MGPYCIPVSSPSPNRHHHHHHHHYSFVSSSVSFMLQISTLFLLLNSQILCFVSRRISKSLFQAYSMAPICSNEISFVSSGPMFSVSRTPQDTPPVRSSRRSQSRSAAPAARPWVAGLWGVWRCWMVSCLSYGCYLVVVFLWNYDC